MLFVSIVLLAGVSWTTGNPDSLGTIPIGTVFLFGGDQVPPGWLLCEGQEMSRLTYVSLFNVIKTLYGMGDHIRTFNLPDFRGRFPLGVNRQAGQTPIMHQGGVTYVTLTQAELPTHAHASGSLTTYEVGDHTHKINDAGHDHGGKTGSGFFGVGGGHGLKQGGNFLDYNNHTHTIPKDFTKISILGGGGHSHVISGQTESIGNGKSFSIMPSYQTINYIIYAGPIFSEPSIGK